MEELIRKMAELKDILKDQESSLVKALNENLLQLSQEIGTLGRTLEDIRKD